MKRFITYSLLVPALALLGGCENSIGTDTGSLSLLLTDAAGDVEQAWVTIDRIYLQAGAGADPGGQLDLMTDPVTTDLVTLADDIEGLVEGAVVPTGSYHQLRVIVSAACIVVEGETEGTSEVYATEGFTQCGEADGTLETPGFDQTGIKVILPGDALEVVGGQQVVLLDFDVAESFGRGAGSFGWVMTPVIRGAEIGLTSAIGVSLTADEGVVFPENGSGETLTLADFAADLSTEEVDQGFGDNDGDGVYTTTFSYLVADAEQSFVVSIEAPEDWDGYTFTFEPSSAEADLVSGQTAEVSFTLVAIEPAS